MIHKRAVPFLFLTTILPLAANAASIQILSYTIATSANAGPFCKDTQAKTKTDLPIPAIGSSIHCDVGMFSTVQASSSASASGLSGIGYIGSNLNHVEGNGLLGFEVSSSLSETLLVEGGALDGTSGFVGVFATGSLDGASDSASLSLTLGDQSAEGCAGVYKNSCGSLGNSFGAEVIIAPFTYGTPFTFAFAGDSFGAEGGNSNEEAGYSLNAGQLFLFSNLPSGYSLGINYLDPRDISSFSEAASTPEPGTTLLGFGGLAALAWIRRRPT